MIHKYRGFTLAEVLITLVIIGVIAAMTIPTLINKTNNQELVSRLKKAYSTMAQATSRIIAEEGNPKGDIGGWATSETAVYNMYKKHLNNAKECGDGSDCYMTARYKHLSGYSEGTTWDARKDMRKMVLSDGTQITIDDVSSPCNIMENHWTMGSDNVCAIIWADTNGIKGPNVFGRDLFAFVLKEDGLHPAGCDVDYCATNQNGFACACKVLREGAINY